MYILHGENVVASRQRLHQLLAQAKEAGKEIKRVEGKELTIAQVELLLGTDNLFGSSAITVIDGVLSLPISKRKDEVLAALASFTASDIIAWEPKAIGVTVLKKFPNAVAELFKPTKSLFRWLDSLTGSSANVNIGQVGKLESQQLRSQQQGSQQKQTSLHLLQETLQQDDAVLVFTLLVRQIRLLIQVKDGSMPVGVAPFLIGKLRHQAATFSLDQLLNIHHQLLKIDLKQKTSQPGLSLGEELALLVAGL